MPHEAQVPRRALHLLAFHPQTLRSPMFVCSYGRPIAYTAAAAVAGKHWYQKLIATAQA